MIIGPAIIKECPHCLQPFKQVGGSSTGEAIGLVSPQAQTQASTNQSRNTGEETGGKWPYKAHKKGVTLRITPS